MKEREEEEAKKEKKMMQDKEQLLRKGVWKEMKEDVNVYEMATSKVKFFVLSYDGFKTVDGELMGLW